MLLKTNTYPKAARNDTIFLDKVPQIFIFYKSCELRTPSEFLKHGSYMRKLTTGSQRSFIKVLNSRGRLDTFRLCFVNFFNKFTSKVLQEPLLQTWQIPALLDIFSHINSIPVHFKFSFHIIDKKIRKYSRGKSGKYKIEFNYLPPFKKRSYIYKIMKKSLKSIKGRTYLERLDKMFNIILFQTHRSLIARYSLFSSKYVTRHLEHTTLKHSY